MQTQEKSILLFLSNNIPKKKRETLCYGNDKKMNSYESQSLVHENELSVLVLQKDAFQNMDFSRSKCQLKGTGS